MSQTLITNGTLIDPATGKNGEFDLLIEKDRIAGVEKRGGFGRVSASATVDAKGKWVVPGLIDMHVHLREPGFEWKETIKSGAEAAILGGFTRVCCMPNTSPTNHSAEITEFMIEKGRAARAARVHPIGAVTVDLKGERLAPLSELRKAGCVAFSDDGQPVWDAGMMRRALEWCLMLDVPICCHEEEKALTKGAAMNESALSHRLGYGGMPKAAEEIMIARDIELARITGGRIHICHVSTARGTELIRRAKQDGIKITAEVCPHHLLLTEQAVIEFGTNAKMSPPLREMADLEALKAGLRDGTLDCIASDHAPHELDTKRCEFGKASFGIIGFPTNVPLTLDLVRMGALTQEKAVAAWTVAPAKILNLDAGTLKPGSLADVTIIDPDREWTLTEDSIRSLSKNTPFIGKVLKGQVTDVWIDGMHRVKDSKLSDWRQG